MRIERYNRRTRTFHTAVYVLTFLLLFSGYWLLSGHEGQPSILARALGQPDTSIHQALGWLLVALIGVAVIVGRHGLVTLARETFRVDRGDGAWLARWPLAIISGHFGHHEGHFDPGQRLANVGIVGSLAALIGSGVGLAFVGSGAAFVWLLQIHTLATIIATVLIVGHVLIAAGVLPGYRGVWRSMHFGGGLSLDTARRVWPGWTERTLAKVSTRREVREGRPGTPVGLHTRVVLRRRIAVPKR